jgi:hypothetical protein
MAASIGEIDMKRIALLALAFAACSPTTPEAPVAPAPVAAPLYLGVLEDRPGSTTSEPSRFMVRVAFQKDAAGWKSLDPNCSDEACLKTGPASLPKETDWTIALHGENKGSVKAATPAEWVRYSDIGTQDVAAGAPAPTAGERAMDFAGWADKPVYRPLVALSAPNVSDPDKWASAPLAAGTQTVLLQAFHTQFPGAQNCKSPEENKVSPITFKDADIAVSGTFASAKGWSIATANLKDYRCDGPMEAPFTPQVFAISADGKATYLGSELQLLDAGDYDADGKSELIFVVNRYNEGGYELRYNGFSGKAGFEVNYH